MSLFGTEKYRRLEEALGGLRGVSLVKPRKLEMKSRLMASLNGEHFGLDPLVNAVRNRALEVRPSHGFRTILREKLHSLVDFDMLRIPHRQHGFSPVARRLSAAGLCAVFMVSLIFNYTFGTRRTEASYFTSLDEVYGTVTVVREGQEIHGIPGLLLRANDTLKTAPASKAVVRFLDDSVSRLDENTEVKIAQLFVNPSNRTETVIELNLTQGRVWTRVINLISDFSRFQINAANTVTVAKRKAAFDVSVSSKGAAKVSALHNRVDLRVASSSRVVETTLVKGFAAQVHTSSGSQATIDAVTLKENDSAWFQGNLTEDKAYIDTVKQELHDQLRQDVTVSPDNVLYPLKQLTENTQIALSLSDLERQKKILDSAVSKLSEAELLLERGSTEAAKKSLEDFKELMIQAINWANFQASSNPDDALVLKTKIAEVLGTYQKQLSLVLPTDALYILKEKLSEVQVLAAGTIAEKTQERLELAADKLLEAHDLIEQGNATGAQAQVEAYSKTMNEVVNEVRNLSGDEKEKAVGALLHSKLDDIKALEAMTAAPEENASATGTSTPVLESDTPKEAAAKEAASAEEAKTLQDLNRALAKSVLRAKTETLTKVGEVVLEIQKAATSPDVVDKLDDIKRIDVNGKTSVNVNVTNNKVLIRTDSKVISITGNGTSTPAVATTTPAIVIPLHPAADELLQTPTSTPPLSDSKTQVEGQVQP